MVGWLFMAAGAGIFLGGLWLTRKFHAVANYSGIGGFRLTGGGCLYFLGVLMILFGLSAVAVGFLLFS